jgi:hypothetical protein
VNVQKQSAKALSESGRGRTIVIVVAGTIRLRVNAVHPQIDAHLDFPQVNRNAASKSVATGVEIFVLRAVLVA